MYASRSPYSTREQGHEGASELGEVANIANFGGTLSPTPRTFTRRPSRHPNLGLEKGIHILPNRAIGFYPTSYGQMNALSHALGTNLTCNRSVCDPACGPSRRIADLLRLLQPYLGCKSEPT